mgnify:CR=1 FL=1
MATETLTPANEELLKSLTSYMGVLVEQTDGLKVKLAEQEKKQAEDQKRIDVLRLELDVLKERAVELQSEKDASDNLDVAEANEIGVVSSKEFVDDAVNQEFDEFADILFDAMEEDEKNSKKFGKISWLKQKVSANLSGANMSKKLKKIIPKISGSLLKKGIVITSLLLATPKDTGGVFEPMTDNQEFKEWQLEEETRDNTKNETAPVIADFDFYNSLPENGKAIYRFEAFGEKKEDHKSYIIADKYTATVYVVSADNVMVKSFPALFGAASGESLHTSSLDTKYPGPGATTPQGMYEMTRNPDLIADHDLDVYGGKFFILKNTTNENGVYMGMHRTANMNPQNFQDRVESLYSATPTDNKQSWTCTNILEKDFDQYIAPYFDDDKESYMIYILPDNPYEAFRFENPYETTPNRVRGPLAGLDQN